MPLTKRNADPSHHARKETHTEDNPPAHTRYWSFSQTLRKHRLMRSDPATSLCAVALLSAAIAQAPDNRHSEQEIWGFGYSMVEVADLSADGRPDFACSAPFGKTRSVFLLSGDRCQLLETIQAASQDVNFGQSLAFLAGEPQRSGLLIVGSPSL